jgi:uncharacterized GH25 family protein
MKRFASLFIAFLVFVAPVRAHFIWILPGEAADKQPTAQIVFNDSPSPGNADLLMKIDKTAAYARNLDLKTTDLKLTGDKAALQVGGLEKGPQVLGAVLKYGVYQKGAEEPALLYYYAKTYVGEDLLKEPPKNLMKPLDKLTLEIVPLVEKKKTIQVLWQGKPLAGAEVVLLVPGRPNPIEGKTDKDGNYEVAVPLANGLYGLRATYLEKADGTFQGEKYSVIRHTATLTFPVKMKE